MLRIILLWLLTFAAAWAGLCGGSLSKTKATLLAGVSCLLLVAGGLTAKNLHWLPEVLICSETVYFQSAWFTPLAAFLFFLAAKQSEISSGKTPRGVKLFALLLLSFSTFRLADQHGYLRGTIGTSPARINSEGIVLQNSGSTCGAASCANLLRRLKIDPEATEAQMIPLCQTGSYGSTPLGMAAGLKSIAGPQGWHVKILQCDAATVSKLQRPAVISLGSPLIANHAVLLISINAGTVEIADPISGLNTMTFDEFRRIYANEAVVLYRNDPFESVN